MNVQTQQLKKNNESELEEIFYNKYVDHVSNILSIIDKYNYANIYEPQSNRWSMLYKFIYNNSTNSMERIIKELNGEKDETEYNDEDYYSD